MRECVNTFIHIRSPIFYVYQVYITEEVDKTLASQLRDIVKRHQGTMVESEDDSTHIIYPVPENAAQTEHGTLSLML